MVYVLSENGQPLMPTKRYGKIRHLLKDGKAKGFFDIRTLDGTKVNKGSMSYKKLELINYNKSYLTEMRAS